MPSWDGEAVNMAPCEDFSSLGPHARVDVRRGLGQSDLCGVDCHVQEVRAGGRGRHVKSDPSHLHTRVLRLPSASCTGLLPFQKREEEVRKGSEKGPSIS